MKRKNNKIIEKKYPQIKGIVTKVYTKTPKKPNSALRKVANVKIIINPTTKYRSVHNVIAYIPGENHGLTVHSKVLLIPKRKKDLPGVKYTVINVPKK